MHNDDSMDQLLRKTMAEKAPELTPGFDDRVMRRVRSRRLTRSGKTVLVAYFVVATATTAWLMRDLPVTAVIASIAISIPVAVATGFYGRRLAGSR